MPRDRARTAALLSIAAGMLCASAAAQTAPQLDPQRALWTAIERGLAGPAGDDYFNSSVKDAVLPMLKATVIDVPSPGKLVLGVIDEAAPDATLILQKRAAEVKHEFHAGEKIEFEAVARTFSLNPFMLVFEAQEAQEPLPGLGALAASWYFGPDFGRIRNGRFLEVGSRLEFALPAGWIVLGARPTVEGGGLAAFVNNELQDSVAAVWTARHKIATSEIPARLQKFLEETITQRADLAHYTIRADSVQPTWIGGQQALEAVADYETSGQRMSELLTCIVTEHARVSFFARTTPERMADLRSRFNPLVYSAFIP